MSVIKDVPELSVNEIEKLPPASGLSEANRIEKRSPVDRTELNILLTVILPPNKSPPASNVKDLFDSGLLTVAA